MAILDDPLYTVFASNEQLDDTTCPLLSDEKLDESFMALFDSPKPPSYFITHNSENKDLKVAPSLAMAGENVDGIINVIYVKNNIWHKFSDLLSVPNMEMFKRFVCLSKGLDALFVNIKILCHNIKDDSFIIAFEASDHTMYMVEFSVNDNGTVACLCCQDDQDDHLSLF